MYEKPVTHTLDAVGGCIDSSTLGRGRGGLQPHGHGDSPARRGTKAPPARRSPQMLSSSVPSAAWGTRGRLRNSTSAWPKSVGHALAQPFAGERFTLPCAMAEKEKSPRHSGDAGASQTTANKLSGHSRTTKEQGNPARQKQRPEGSLLPQHSLHLPNLQTKGSAAHHCQDLPCGSAVPLESCLVETPPLKPTGGTPDLHSWHPAVAMCRQHCTNTLGRGS